MAFEPHATSFSKTNAHVLAQASAMAYREPAQCKKWAEDHSMDDHYLARLETKLPSL